jgi:uncharacterized protein YjbI with pentapeptide repeats
MPHRFVRPRTVAGAALAALLGYGCGLVIDTDPPDPDPFRDASAATDFGGADDATIDAGAAVDASADDATIDAGAAVDASTEDAGIVPVFDGGARDAGDEDASAADAAPGDAGLTDAGPDACCVPGLDLGVDMNAPDLGRADLGGTDLGRADLGGTDLGRADLGGADFGTADMGRSDVEEACDPNALVGAPTSCPLGKVCCRDSFVCRDPAECLAEYSPCRRGCPVGEYCLTPEGRCSADGMCVPRYELPVCTGVDVCGCDGNTYADVCAARAAGVSIASMSPCPE